MSEGPWAIKQKDPVDSTFKIAGLVYVKNAHAGQVESWFRVTSVGGQGANYVAWNQNAADWKLALMTGVGKPADGTWEQPGIAVPKAPNDVTFDHYVVVSSPIRTNVPGTP